MIIFTPVRDDKFVCCVFIYNKTMQIINSSKKHYSIYNFNLQRRNKKYKNITNNNNNQSRLTWAKEKKNWTAAQWSKVLFSDESKCCISFGNQDPRVWRKGGEVHSQSSLKSSVKFPQSVMIWGAMSSASVGCNTMST